MSQARAPTRLIVVLEAGNGALERLAVALDTAAIASVIIAPGAGRSLDATSTAPLVTAAQKAGAAALLSNDARLARTLKADGIHLPASETLEDDYAQARQLISERFVVGVDAGRIRHDAMAAGESGADYIGFGIAAAAVNRDEAIVERLELIGWWAEIFEIPCVAFDVETVDEARDLARMGAEFVALRITSGLSPVDVQALVHAFDQAILAVSDQSRT